MVFHMRSPRRRAFTLIELLVVIALIAILMLIVVSRLLHAGRKTREATMRANLYQIREAVARFEADMGIFPGLLQDLVAPSGAELSSYIPAIVQENYKGPYLTDTGGIPIPGFYGVPINPFVRGSDTDEAHHWTYNRSNGEVYCPADIGGTTLDGVAYTDL